MTLSDVAQLTKIRLNSFTVSTVMVAYLWPGWDWNAIWVALGSLALASSSAVFNQILEIESDRAMGRTQERPLATGRVSSGSALLLGVLLLLAGLGLVYGGAHGAAAMVGLWVVFYYVVAYTPSKFWTSWNTFTGAIAGGLPPVIGWVARYPESLIAPSWDRDWPLWYLFGILFLWQFPHFFAINWRYRHEYREAGYVMLANHDREGKVTSTYSLMTSFLLAIVSFFPFMESRAAWWWFPVVFVLNAFLGYKAWIFFRDRTDQSARLLFFATLLYLPLVFFGIYAAAYR